MIDWFKTKLPLSADRRIAGYAAAAFLLVLPTPHTNALRFLALGIAVLFAIRAGALRQWRELPLKWPFAFLTAIALLSVPLAVNPLYALQEIKAEIGYGFIVLWLFYSQTTDRSELRLWFGALALSFAAMSLSVIASIVQGGNGVTLAYFYNGIGSYSTFVLTLFPFGFVFLLTAPRPRKIWFGAAVAASVATFIVYVAATRWFWVSLVTAAFVLVALLVREKLLRRASLGLLLAVVLTSGFVFYLAAQVRLVGPHTESDVLESTVTIDPRPALWRFSIHEIAASPWVGKGFGLRSFHYAYPDMTKQAEYLFHAHNLFLNAGIQMGVPGILALVVLFGAVLRRFYRLHRSAGDVRFIGAIGIAMIVAVIMKSMTDQFFYRENALLFWALTGAMLGYAKHYGTNDAVIE